MTKKINNSFKDLYNWCSKETKDKIEDIIIKNLNFSDYFSLNEYLIYILDMIQHTQLDESYNILMIFFYLRQKIKQNNFMNQLEKDYGVYLDSENAIKEINHMIDNLIQFKDLNFYFINNFDKIIIDIYALIYCLENKIYLNFDKNKQDNKSDPLYLYINEIKSTKCPKRVITFFIYIEKKYDTRIINPNNFFLKCYYNKIELKISIILTILLNILIPKVKSIIKSFKENMVNLKCNNFVNLKSNCFENLKPKLSNINLANLKTNFVHLKPKRLRLSRKYKIVKNLFSLNSLNSGYPSIHDYILNIYIRKCNNFIDKIALGGNGIINGVKIINREEMEEEKEIKFKKFKIDKQFKRGEKQKSKLERKKWNKIRIKKYKFK